MRSKKASVSAPVQKQSVVNPGEPMVQMKSEGRLLENFLRPGEASRFVLFRSSADRMRHTDIMESNLLYPQFTDLNVKLIRKHPPN